MSRFFSIPEAPAYFRASILYERKPVTDLWNRLTAAAKQQWKWRAVANKKHLAFMPTQRRILQVHGPPGILASRVQLIAGFIQLSKRSVRIIMMYEPETETNCWTISQDTGSADAVFADIVVLDDIRAVTVECWRGFVNALARAGVAVILISSEGVRLHEGDSQDIMKFEHFVPSWIKEEYLAACLSNDFWGTSFNFFENATQHDNFQIRSQLVDEKYEIAGQSARFMFHTHSRFIQDTISRLAESLGGIDALEASVRSDRSVGAGNSLVARTQVDKNGITPTSHALLPVAADLTRAATGVADLMPSAAEFDQGESVPRLVSTYASEQVIKAIPSSIERLLNLARSLSNKVIEGYAFEEQLKTSLRVARNPGLNLRVVIDGRDVPLSVDTLIVCNAPGEVESTLKQHRNPNTCIFVAGHQGAFDAIHGVV
eukprot:scaffold51059_cov53-Attheya_sp.AAC.2